MSATATMAFSNKRSVDKSNLRALCKCLGNEACNLCSVSRDGDLVETLITALQRLDNLNSQVTSLKGHICSYDSRLKKIETSGSECSESEKNNASTRNRHCKRQKKMSNKSKVRSDRREQMKNNSSKSEECSSEDDLGLNYMSRVSNNHQGKSVAKAKKSRVQVYEESDSSDGSSENSGTDSKGRKRCRRSRTVKSGANVKQRPVIRTELWPHTIAIENEGMEVSSEDISLSKFFSCFTHIMVSCTEKTETAGRSVLLHAVSTVLECLPWSEARCFHNLTMVKIEQGRLNWDSDFTALANQFLDKKVRMNLRLRNSSVNSNSNRSSNNHFGKGSGNFSNGYNSNINRNFPSPISVICRLWNGGICSFGADCKRWHVCLSCAKEGKLGEKHKAATHGESSANWHTSEQHI